MNSPIYCTGVAPDGKPLLGGIWKMYSEQGLPIEISHMEAEERGCHVDWLEALADASMTADAHRLVREMEQFMGDAMHGIKTAFVNAMRKFSHFGTANDDVRTYQSILIYKRQNALSL